MQRHLACVVRGRRMTGKLTSHSKILALPAAFDIWVERQPTQVLVSRASDAPNIVPSRRAEGRLHALRHMSFSQEHDYPRALLCLSARHADGMRFERSLAPQVKLEPCALFWAAKRKEYRNDNEQPRNRRVY